MLDEWRLIIDGLAFGEGLRWHDDELWFSDIFGRQVLRVDDEGLVRPVVDVPGCPSGLGWSPDGRLLLVSMRDRCLLSLNHNKLEIMAELGGLVGGDCNDMIVDRLGRAYIGNLGYDYAKGDVRKPADLVLVDSDGVARIVARNLWSPNGMTMSPDGHTLYVAETAAQRVSVFVVAEDGSLHERRVLDRLGGLKPDGICLDGEGHIWMASAGTGEVARVSSSGTIVERTRTPSGAAQGCVLGGIDGRTLYVSSTNTHNEDEALEQRGGCIYARQVHTSAAERP